ncbi:MAG: hypothetical protein EZS28_017591 [Streblomastix strix]|uniref:Uncharacterized protein n=1 Tax=Streblomastix strix TaxID=222440 RepID=A0A5J4VVZ2_9EUKA|nr:MAG: hypothetical protein EZS28_017591 [Streblomastix strix]
MGNNESKIAVPKEYNVRGSLNGLGLDVLMDVLGETLYAKDAQNLVGVSKQTLKLKDHPRFFMTTENLIQGLNVPNKIWSEGETVKEDGQSDGISFVHTNKNNNKCTITVDPIVEDGISKLEFIFEGHEQNEFSFGICDSSEVFYQNSGREGSGVYSIY